MSDRSLEGRVALVTGASSGVGRATALLLAQHGCIIHAVARRSELLEDLAQEDGNIHVHAMDVADRVATERLAAHISREQQGLDIVVAAAGTNVRRRRLDELSLDDWQSIMDTNVTGTFNVIQTCLPLLRVSRALIIVIASVSSRWPDISGVAYQASKRAVLGLAHAVGLEERDRGVRVSSILPGLINTPLVDLKPAPPNEETRTKALRAEDVARVCLFLAGLPAHLYVPELVLLPTDGGRVPA
jgi:NAD(P)-dependent dehydrogenase (short-subunit alcohol dehydrogenase family)